MKKIYFSLLALVLLTSAQAQLSLTKAANEPVIGDVNTKKAYDSVAVLPKNTGMNQTWDFSALTSNTITEVSTFTTVASTPNGSNYAGATMAESDGNGGYTYWKSTPGQYELLGFDSPGVVVNFTNSAVAAVWPATYGYNNSDAFAGSATINGTLTGTATGSLTTLGSGTGTLIIPGGTQFTNVLQTKTTQVLNLNLLGGFVTATITAIDYNYYHGTQKFPLLTVSYSSTSGAFTDYSAGVMVNNAVITGINDYNFDASFNVFPNPAKHYVTVDLSNKNNETGSVEIINSVGQSVQTVHLGTGTHLNHTINISGLASGVYVIKTSLGEKISARKLIVE